MTTTDRNLYQVQPAVGAGLDLNVNPPGLDERVIASPSLNAGKYLGLGTNLVQAPDGTTYLKGGVLSIGVYTPTIPFLPGNVGIPIQNNDQ